jgi:hypothetical protein
LAKVKLQEQDRASSLFSPEQNKLVFNNSHVHFSDMNSFQKKKTFHDKDQTACALCECVFISWTVEDCSNINYEMTSELPVFCHERQSNTLYS